MKTEAQQLKIKYNKTNLKVATRYRSGSNKLVVFLHGLGCSQKNFSAAFTDPSLERFSILTLDFIGYGKSDKPENFSYELKDQADVTQQVLSNFSYKTITIVGHSLGGAIGLLTAMKLTISAKFISVEGNLIAKDTSYVSRQTARQSEMDFIDHGFQNFLTRLKKSNRKDFQNWATNYTQASPLAVHRSACSLVKWCDSGQLLDYFLALPQASYVYGDEENQDYLLSKILKVDKHCVPRSGHFVMVDNPQDFYQTVAELCR